MKIEITEKKLRAALQIAFAEHGLEDESILDTMETYIKALSITAVVQAKPEVCDHKNWHLQSINSMSYRICDKCGSAL